MKELADDHFKFDEHGRKLSKWVENTVGKRRNCSLRVISPFPTGSSKGVIVWEWVNSLPDLYSTLGFSDSAANIDKL